MISLNRLRIITQGRIRSNSPDFEFGFLVSLNDTISDLVVETVLDITAIDEDDPPANLSLDSKYNQVIMDGIEYHLQRNFSWARVNKEFSDAVYRRSLAKAQAEAIEDADLPVSQDYEVET